MLFQRKRFNYMANTNYSSSLSKKTYGSAIKPTISAFHDQNNNQTSRMREDKDLAKRVQDLMLYSEELEGINKKLVDETAKQFKKLEEDVQRVETILGQKENQLENVKQHNQALTEQVNKISEEKKILIEAIFEKDLVIKEYQMKVKELIEETAAANEVVHEAKTPEKVIHIENEEISTQTDPLPESCPKNEYTSVQKHNFQLEDETYRLKEELFDATNKVKLLTQQFEAYKILKEIESVQES